MLYPEAYFDGAQEELRTLIRALCAIPAPSGLEDRRAAFCRDFFLRAGAEDVVIDEAKNAVCRWHDDGVRPLAVFMAHTDTVFPDLEPMPMHEEDGKLLCPGVTDDTAQLAVLMTVARWFLQSGLTPDCGVLFVANSGEEGLGNLRGSRQIVKDYGERIRTFVTFDGTTLNRIVNQAVGSHRYRVTARTEGGHSFNNFGRPNAIHLLSRIVDRIFSLPIPEGGKTTYNVGTIAGGTSVNTIAQQAEMLCEYRADRRENLAAMEAAFDAIFREFREAGADLTVERVGERPCSLGGENPGQQALEAFGAEVIRRTTGLEPRYASGSTDANIPLSVGIPAVCLGAVVGGGCHTREEWLDLTSLPDGCRLAFEAVAGLAFGG